MWRVLLWGSNKRPNACRASRHGKYVAGFPERCRLAATLKMCCQNRKRRVLCGFPSCFPEPPPKPHRRPARSAPSVPILPHPPLSRKPKLRPVPPFSPHPLKAFCLWPLRRPPSTLSPAWRNSRRFVILPFPLSASPRLRVRFPAVHESAWRKSSRPDTLPFLRASVSLRLCVSPLLFMKNGRPEGRPPCSR